MAPGTSSSILPRAPHATETPGASTHSGVILLIETQGLSRYLCHSKSLDSLLVFFLFLFFFDSSDIEVWSPAFQTNFQGLSFQLA